MQIFQSNQGFIHLAKSCKQSRSFRHNVFVLSLIRRMDKCITPLMLECICTRANDFIYLVQSAAESVSLSQNPRHPAVVSLTPPRLWWPLSDLQQHCLWHHHLSQLCCTLFEKFKTQSSHFLDRLLIGPSFPLAGQSKQANEATEGHCSKWGERLWKIRDVIDLNDVFNHY